MKTITFYSYKGGVGRTMALMNVAWRLAAKGKRVGVVDLDLEAPGLSMVEELCASDDDARPKGVAAFLRAVEAEAGEGKRERIVPILDFCHLVRDPSFEPPGEILFLPAVGGAEAEITDDAEYVAEFLRPPAAPNDASQPQAHQRPPRDPAHLQRIKTDFQTLREPECEYLLVDSRTGLNAISALATVLYPEEVVMVFGLNRQNIQGLRVALEAFGPKTRDTTYLLPSLVPVGEEQLKGKALEELDAVIEQMGIPKDKLLTQQSLPYHPQVALDDRPMLVRGLANFLAERYEALAAKLISLNPQDPIALTQQATEKLEAEKPEEAVRLLSPLCARKRFRRDKEFLLLYSRACYQSGFTTGAEAPLLRVMHIEREESRASGGRGVPTMRTALLYYERMKKAKRDRSARVAFVERALDFEGTDEDRGNLYGELRSAYLESPPDVEGLFRFNRRILDEAPRFAGAAAAAIADIHAIHGRFEEGDRAFAEAEHTLARATDEGLADRKALVALYLYWARYWAALRQWDQAAAKFRALLEVVEESVKPSVHLQLARALAERAGEPGEAEIAYLERARQEFPKDDGILRSLAILYEREGSKEGALECRRQLLELAPWDEREALLRVSELEAELRGSFDEAYERKARRWVDETPNDVYSTVLLGELLLRRGAVSDAIEVYVNAAQGFPENADPLVAAMHSAGQERWKKPQVVAQLVKALGNAPFAQLPWARYQRAHLLGVLGEWEQATEAALSAAALAPSDQWTSHALMAVRHLERIERWPQALEFVEQKLHEHPEDVNWPVQAALVYVRAAAGWQGVETEQLLARALVILRELQDRTGPMQLDTILPQRYSILAERLRRPEAAWEDLAAVRDTKYTLRRDVALRALPSAEKIILIASRKWGEALSLLDEMARHEQHEEAWGSCVATLADFQFYVGQPAEALATLQKLDEHVIEANRFLRLLQTRCMEALGESGVAGSLLAKLREQLEAEDIYRADTRALRDILRVELRFPDGGERAADAAFWLGVEDVNRWSGSSQASLALHDLCFGSAEQAELHLERLSQIMSFYNWQGEFLHDLRMIQAVHPTKLSYDEVATKLPPLPSVASQQ